MQYLTAPNRSFVASAALAAHRLCKLSAGKLAYAGASDSGAFCVSAYDVFAADAEISADLLNAVPSVRVKAAGSFSAGATLYQAADGKVDDSGTIECGIAMQAAVANDVIEMVPLREASYGLGFEFTQAASVTTDGHECQIQVLDAAGNALAGVRNLLVHISEAADGEGLTAETTGTLTVVSAKGVLLVEHVDDKLALVQTNDAGIVTLLLVSSANEADQYFAVTNPYNGVLSVSAATGVLWEGV